MNNIPDLMLQAEMDYRLERTRQAWGTLRRSRDPRREGRNTARRAAGRDTLA
jgi:hypothetical protein